MKQNQNNERKIEMKLKTMTIMTKKPNNKCWFINIGKYLIDTYSRYTQLTTAGEYCLLNELHVCIHTAKIWYISSNEQVFIGGLFNDMERSVMKIIHIT